MKSRRGAPAEWSVYIVRCGDDSLYTGVAKDVAARVEAHNAGRGAAYTRSRLPVSLVWSKEGFTRSAALSREAAVKRLPRALKQALAAGKRP
ncbi:MAG: GIY-YIG nuclease family protein [Elusimicrobiota bacterium]|nr:GIY-YIG nuclease family protein [Elusimicrobiota bacterium]